MQKGIKIEYPWNLPVTGEITDVLLYDESESGNPIRDHNTTYFAGGEPEMVQDDQLSVTYAYDGALRVTGVTDGNNNKTVYAFDPAGEEQSVTYASGTSNAGTISFPYYDGVGRVTQRTDANGQVTTYGYKDGDGLLNSITYAAPWTSLDVSLTYDNFDRLQSSSDGSGAYGFSYDDLDDVTENTTTYSGQAENKLDYTYYPDDTLENESSNFFVTPARWTYYYDNDSRLVRLTCPKGETDAWSYLANGWLHSQTDNFVSSTNYGPISRHYYDNLGRITEVQNNGQNGTNLISDFNVATSGNPVGYDGAGNILSETVNIPGASNLSGTITNTYDSFDQLSTSSAPYWNSLSFYSATSPISPDAGGNLTKMRSVSGYTYNSRDQIQLTGYGFDGNGNETSYAGSTLVYDPENRMTSYGTAISNMGYRADGLRASKTSNGSTTFYIYDINGDPVLETNDDNLTAINTFGADGLVSRWTSGTGNGTVYYQFNERGDTATRFDSSGNVKDCDSADVYGKHYSSNESGDPYEGFGAQWGYFRDSETGKYLLGHRYYDPTYCRFFTQDPAGIAGGIDPYSFASNNPVGFADPSGYAPLAVVEAGLLHPGLSPGEIRDIAANFALGMSIAYNAYNRQREAETADISMGDALFSGVLGTVGPSEEGGEGGGTSEGDACPPEGGGDGEGGLTRVWRFMTRPEYDKMKATGRVQASYSAATASYGPERTSVTTDPATFKAGKPPGQWVNFLVPSENVHQGGKEAWRVIFGGNSMYGKLYKVPVGMPEAKGLSPWPGP